MKFKVMLPLFAAVCGLLSGCCGFKAPEEIVVLKTSEPIKIDGTANEKFWAQAPAYNLMFSDAQAELNGYCNLPSAAGKVKFACDDKNLYVFGKFDDDDIVQYAEKNHGHFYTSGDVMEVFLMNADTRHYFEIYGTPNGKYSLMFFHNRGRMIFPQALDESARLEVASKVYGSLNNCGDKDKGYTIEMAIPLAEINKHGDRFGKGKWLIMASRYNYSAYLDDKELSSTSKLKKTNFHERESYIPLVIKNAR